MFILGGSKVDFFLFRGILPFYGENEDHLLVEIHEVLSLSAQI
jgi:hypothetical protein